MTQARSAGPGRAGDRMAPSRTLVCGAVTCPQPMHYRPDIDGLRGIAVLLVVAFHAFPGAIPGGFVGVDIFFVISGFLITGIIVDAQRAGQFSFREFYYRRIRRIFPALILVLAVTYGIGWRLLLPNEFVSLGRNLVGGAAFASNFVLWSEIGYFDFSADRKPLLHLWSLGIEEQFYIFWPLTMWLAARLRPRSAALPVVAWSVLLASWVCCVTLSALSPAAGFYLPITRIWEILSGAVLALQPTNFGGLSACPSILRAFFGRTVGNAGTLAREARSLVGLGLVIFAAASFDKHQVFPGWRATLPVLGTFLLISAEGSWINRCLSRPAVVYIGLISYPLYLWHWPLLVFLRNIDFLQGGRVPWQELVAAIVLAVVLASLTYHFVEKPIRAGAPRPARILAFCGAMAGLACLGLVTADSGLAFRLPEPVRAAIEMPNFQEGWRAHRCFLEHGEALDPFRGRECIDDGKKPLVFLWGDSSAAALFPGLRAMQHAGGFRLAEFALSACPPIIGLELSARPGCKEGNDLVFAAAERERPQVVLLHAKWTYGFQGDASVEQVARTIETIQRLGPQRIVLIGPPPRWRGSLQRLILEYYFRHHAIVPEFSTFGLIDDSQKEDLLRRAATRLNVTYLSLHELMCAERGCLTRVGDGAKNIAAFDDSHLTAVAAEFVAERMLPLLPPPQAVEANFKK